MSLFPILDGKSLPELVNHFVSNPLAHGVEPNEGDLFLQEVTVKIARCGSEGAAFLLDSLMRADVSRQQAILVALGFVDKRAINELLGRLKAALALFLSNPDPQLVAKSVDCITQLGLTEMAESVTPLLNHASPFVVGSVLRFLSIRSPSQAKPILLKALESPHPIIRQNAVDELDDLDCKEALPSILVLLNDPDKNVREAAHWATEHLQSMEK